ncbi:MAG: class I SAM-dependent methyltransferase [Gammaproteobacteria bacterium]|nr:class I SAM-dependent methyltransferase [Gammaproteobacteria bacterium]MDH5801154.1 class I SAM-dependent methyltransferase [Gammaproteobacteria bacterium]
MKPYSESCEQNRAPILEVLQQEITSQAQSLLEIGSGTGQHAVYFAPRFPKLNWQTSDVVENLPGIQMWLDESASENLPPPLALNVLSQWPSGKYDLIYSANTTHIMSWEAVLAMFAGMAGCLNPQGKVVLYGPFNYGGNYTSPSNARFDEWLKQRDPRSGIRDFDDLNHVAQKNGFSLQRDVAMPANNRILIWQQT